MPVRAQDARRLFEQGMEAFRKGNYGSAELLFRKTLDHTTDEYRDRAWFHLARSMHARKNYRSAIFEFNSFLNRCTTESLAVEARYWMGESRYFLGDYHEAMEEFRRYILKSPAGSLASRAHERMGDMYHDQKRGDEAIIEWDAAIEKEGDAARKRSLRYRKARALFELGRYDEALAMLPRPGMIGGDREDALMMMLAGQVYQKLGDDRNAVRAFRSIPAEMKDDAILGDSALYEARSLQRLGDGPAAEVILREYLGKGGETRMYQEARCELGALLLGGSKSAEGIEFLEGVRSSGAQRETRVRASKLLGLFYIERQPVKSATYLEETLEGASPEERSGLLLLLGRAYLLAGRHDEALAKFSTIIDEAPFARERDDAGFYIGVAYLDKGDFERSIEAFGTIRRDQPFSRHYAESRYYLALARSRMGDQAGAIAILEEHLRDGDSAKRYEATLLFFRLLIEKGDLPRAGRIAEALMREHPGEEGLDGALLDYAAALLGAGIPSKKQIAMLAERFGDTENGADLHYMVANDHYKKKRYDVAMEHYNAYLDTPYSARRSAALLGRTRSLYEMGRHEEVVASTGNGGQNGVDPKSMAEWHLLRARSLYRLERYKESYETFDATRLEGYESGDLRMFLECAIRVGNLPSAMKALRLLERDREIFSGALFFLGRFYMEKNELREAEAYLKRVVDECPGCPYEVNALLSLGELRLIRGDPRGALALVAGIEMPAGDELRSMKNALVIRCHFSLGMAGEALAMTEKDRQVLLRCPCGEPVMKLALEHYYRKKDLQQFKRYATFLARYDGNKDLIEYLAGKLSLETGQYSAAYRHFKELSAMGTRYRIEALYQMGVHELHVLGDASAAGKTFSLLIAESGGGDAIRVKALLEMALIYRERGDDAAARDCLVNVIRLTSRGSAHTQAMNLIEQFGYEGP